MGVLRIRNTAILGILCLLSGCATMQQGTFREATLVEARVLAEQPTAKDREHVLQPSKWLSEQAGQGTGLQADLSGGCGCAEVSGTSFWSGLSDTSGVDTSSGNHATLRVDVEIPPPVPPVSP